MVAACLNFFGHCGCARQRRRATVWQDQKRGGGYWFAALSCTFVHACASALRFSTSPPTWFDGLQRD
jgi:hypothetical protein